MSKTKKNIILIVIILLIIFIAGVVYWYNNSITTKQYNNDIYGLKYDSTWKIVSKKDLSIDLKHDSGSKIEIYLLKINQNTANKTIEDIAKDIESDIKSNYKGYNLINNEKSKLTKKNYPGYKLLFENGKSQQLVSIGKTSKYIFVINYTANNYYFDMLIDSVNNIVYNFTI